MDNLISRYYKAYYLLPYLGNLYLRAKSISPVIASILFDFLGIKIRDYPLLLALGDYACCYF